MVKYDRVVWQVSAFIILVSLVLLFLNQLLFHFPVVNFPVLMYTNIAVYACFLIYGAGFYVESLHPRAALICKTIGLFNIVALVMLIADSAFFTTPFSLKDWQVMQGDHLIGFHLLPFVNFFYQHPFWNHVFDWIYSSLFVAIIAIPILLAVLNDRAAVYRYMIANLWACLIGYLIYYFFPTSDPSDVMYSAHFPEMSFAIPIQFAKNHQFILDSSYRAGFISLPSFHTIWAVLLIFATYRFKWLFYFILLFSSAVVFSTLTTGWHFILDDIAGIIVAIIAWVLAVRSTKHVTTDNVANFADL